MERKNFIKNNNLEDLNQDDLSKIFKAHKNGFIEGRNIIVEHNIFRLINTIENNFKDYSDKSELVDVGLIALIEYVDSFNSDNYMSFKKKFYEYITRKISSFIKQNERCKKSDEVNIVNIPDCMDDYIKKSNIEIINSLLSKLDLKKRNIIEMYFGFYGKRYSIKEIAEKYKTSQKCINELIKITLFEFRCSLEKNNTKSSAFANVEHLMNGLSDLKKNVIRMYFGIDTDRQYSMKEIAEKLGITIQYVSLIVKDFDKKAAGEVNDKISTRTSFIIRDMYKKDSDRCQKILNMLSLKRQNVINSYFGFNGWPTLNKEQICRDFNISLSGFHAILKNYRLLLENTNYEDTIFYKIETNQDSVNRVLQTMTENSKCVVALNYGINIKRIDKEDIAKELGVDNKYISSALTKFKIRLNNEIENKNNQNSKKNPNEKSMYYHFMKLLDSEKFQSLLYKLPLDDVIALRIKLGNPSVKSSNIRSFLNMLYDSGITFDALKYSEDVKILTSLIASAKDKQLKKSLKIN